MNPIEYKRPEVLEGYTRRVETPCGSFYITLNEHEFKLKEVRMTMGKSGTCFNIMFQTLALLISKLLQTNVDREDIKKLLYHQFEGRCGNGFWNKGDYYNSCIDFAITRIFEDMASRNEISLEENAEQKTL